MIIDCIRMSQFSAHRILVKVRTKFKYIGSATQSPVPLHLMIWDSIEAAGGLKGRRYGLIVS